MPAAPLSAPRSSWLKNLRRWLAMPALWRRIYPDPDALTRRARRAMLLGSWQLWPLHLRLLDFWESHPTLAQLLATQPTLLRKVQKVYPFDGLTDPTHRALWLMQHHRCSLAVLPAVQLQALALDQAVLVCRVALPKGAGVLNVQLRLALDNHLREGDWMLELQDPFGTRLYTLTFSLLPLPWGMWPGATPTDQDQTQAPACEPECPPCQRPELRPPPAAADVGLLIGAVQGQLSLELGRHLTKLCLGLRPPNLLLFVLQELARGWGLGSLHACGWERHIHVGKERAERVHFDYDAFWDSVGGQARPGGFFQLPLQAQRRSHEEMPSHKRSQYLRRYAWLDELATDVAQRLAQAGPPDSPPQPPPEHGSRQQPC